MRNLILCDLKKIGPDSSFEAKVMAVLSLDSESGFLARCWKGGGFGFVDRVGFRDRICLEGRFCQMEADGKNQTKPKQI